MRSATAAETVRFTTKGQVVIPLRLRKEFHIAEGTRAVIVSTPEGILLQPVTRWAIERGHGLLKRAPKPGEKSAAEGWAEHKREELALEEAKYARRPGA